MHVTSHMHMFIEGQLKCTIVTLEAGEDGGGGGWGRLDGE
jgi:hypothetical protein